MKEGGTSLNKTSGKYNLLFKGLINTENKIVVLFGTMLLVCNE